MLKFGPSQSETKAKVRQMGMNSFRNAEGKNKKGQNWKFWKLVNNHYSEAMYSDEKDGP